MDRRSFLKSGVAALPIGLTLPGTANARRRRRLRRSNRNRIEVLTDQRGAAEARSSKFAAWGGRSATTNPHGIRIQIMDVAPHQRRQNIHANPVDRVVEIASVAAWSHEPGWEPRNILDNNDDTAWSSLRSPSEWSSEWIAVWFQPQPINFVELTPRRYGARAYCFPQQIGIDIVDRTNTHWIRYKDITNVGDPGTSPRGVRISLDKEVKTGGIRIHGIRLRRDPPVHGSNFYMQLAGVKVGLSTISFDVSSVRSAVRRFPNDLFFPGDELDMRVPPDAYASAYDSFYHNVKAVSPVARVSPCGFTFGNSIYGPTYTDYAARFHSLIRTSVDEWRFHNFYGSHPSDYDRWESQVRHASAWSRSHGAPMVLGSFGSPGDSGDTRNNQRRAMQFIKEDANIVEAVYWHYTPFQTQPHPLVNRDIQLTPDGTVFVEEM